MSPTPKKKKEVFIDDDPLEQGGDDDGAPNVKPDDPYKIPPDAGDPGQSKVEGQEEPEDFDDVPVDPDKPTEDNS